MKDLTAVLVVALMAVFAVRYIQQIHQGVIKPALSTWLMFLGGTGLSLATYLTDSKGDIVSGVLNFSDVLIVFALILATLRWSRSKVKFRPFEKWYLLGAGGIAVFWFFSGDAFTSNLIVQLLILVGYLPTIHKLVAEKENTESYTSWGIALAAVSVACYPAMVGGNTLSTIYAVRSVVMVLVVIGFMLYCDFSRKRE